MRRNSSTGSAICKISCNALVTFGARFINDEHLFTPQERTWNQNPVGKEGRGTDSFMGKRALDNEEQSEGRNSQEFNRNGFRPHDKRWDNYERGYSDKNYRHDRENYQYSAHWGGAMRGEKWEPGKNGKMAFLDYQEKHRHKNMTPEEIKVEKEMRGKDFRHGKIIHAAEVSSYQKLKWRHSHVPSMGDKHSYQDVDHVTGEYVKESPEDFMHRIRRDILVPLKRRVNGIENYNSSQFIQGLYQAKEMIQEYETELSKYVFEDPVNDVMKYKEEKDRNLPGMLTHADKEMLQDMRESLLELKWKYELDE